jgi:hypothetical protein
MSGMSIIVICPTRGRPKKAREAYDAYLSTKVLETTKMVFVVDLDDPDFDAYVKEQLPIVSYAHEGGGMAPPVNAAAADMAPLYDVTGFVGDDHRFRSLRWDMDVEAALVTPGFAYGNDLIRNDIPTQVFISSKIVLALGWFCLPGAKHLYLDDTWRVLGEGSGNLRYMPDTVIEHAHPFFGRGEMDEGYARVNAPAMYQHDSAVFQAWLSSGQAEKDIQTVKGVL